jgi:hypothetical protein
MKKSKNYYVAVNTKFIDRVIVVLANVALAMFVIKVIF